MLISDPAPILAALEGEGSLPPVVVGFDGFVDEIITVVGERRSPTEFTALGRIPEFASWIGAAAGRSSLREIVIDRQDPGGCAINLGDGLAALDVPVEAFGTFGDPIHPAFASVTSRFRGVTSWGSCVGRTLALEFADGKVMLSAVAQLAALDPGLIARVTADGAFTRAAAGAALLGFTNWTLYPHMTAVWRFLQAGPLAGLSHRPRILLDLVDPSGRAREDLAEALQVAAGFGAIGPVTLGVNVHEANQIARLDGATAVTDHPDHLVGLAQAIRQRWGFDEVVIHALRWAVCDGSGGSALAAGPWCATPRKLTGAGDRFHAGLSLGHLLALPAPARLTLANAASGFFVRNARSPTRGELTAFLRSWAAGSLDQNSGLQGSAAPGLTEA